MKVDVKLEGLDGVLKTLQSLPPEVVSKRGGPVRLSLAKGARVLRNEAQKNLRTSIEAPGKTKITNRTGFTEKNVVAMRKDPPVGMKGERFIVTVRPVNHPSARRVKRTSRRSAKSKRKVRARKERQVQANDIAFMFEFGTSQQEPLPWLKPAFLSKASESIEVVRTDLISRVDRIVRKLAAQNSGGK